MTKEQKIQECESKQLIDELSKMPPMVIATAYLHAINYTLYGEDVTEKWVTATQNARALEKAHRDGYCEALQKLAKSEYGMWIPVSERLPNLNDFNGPCVWQKKVLITGYLSFDDTKDLFVSEAYASDVVYDRVFDTVVVAWMPLPKPYKS